MLARRSGRRTPCPEVQAETECLPTSDQRMKILVVGATGVLGRQVVAKLRSRDVSVRAFSRSADRASDLVASEVEVVVGDLVDPASVKRACVGVDRVLAAAHGMLGRGRHGSERVDDAGHRTLIAASRDAGVSRFVYVSARGASADHPVDFFRTKNAIELALAASGLPYVVLRPTAFMEQHAHAFNGAGLLANGTTRLIGPGTKKRNFVAASDVADFAVRGLLDDPLPFRLLEIGGPGNYSNREVMELYARTAGIEPRASHLPVVVARFLAVALAQTQPGRARVMKLMSLGDATHPERFDDALALEETYGVRMTRLEDFVSQRVAQSNAPS